LPRGNIPVLGLTITSVIPTAKCYFYNVIPVLSIYIFLLTMCEMLPIYELSHSLLSIYIFLYCRYLSLYYQYITFYLCFKYMTSVCGIDILVSFDLVSSMYICPAVSFQDIYCMAPCYKAVDNIYRIIIFVFNYVS
jgi:hypothetical protein